MDTAAVAPPQQLRSSDSSYRDPLLDAPLTSLSTNTTYQNWHCAYCHRDLDIATTVIWNASFSCYGSDPPTALSDETIAEHLSFNPLTSRWNLNMSTYFRYEIQQINSWVYIIQYSKKCTLNAP
jgi:hypothetical protein